MTDESIEQQLLHIAHESAYLTPTMVRFLLGENLALKNLLYEKGILDPEEFKLHKAKALEILDASMKDTVTKELKRVAERIKPLKEMENNVKILKALEG